MSGESWTRRRAACAFLVAAAFFAAPECAPAQEAGGRTTADVAAEYVTAYEAKDIDALMGFYTDETILEDPTMSAAGREVRLTGAAAIRPFLQESFDGVTGLRLEVSRRFASGPYAVINGVGRYSVPGSSVGVEAETFELWADFTFVLEVRDEKVVRHTDYVDYEGMMARIPR